MSERASIFDNSPDFDLAGFEPKKEKRGGETTPDTISAVSEASGFRSREPGPSVTEPAEKKDDPLKRTPRRYRTGRNVQLNIKVSAETIESFYAWRTKKAGSLERLLSEPSLR